MAEQEVTGTEDVESIAGETVVTTETSSDEATADDQTSVTDEQLTEAQAEERQKQSDYDYAVSKSEKWDQKFADLKTKHPDVNLLDRAERKSSEETTESVTSANADEYMTVGQFESGMKTLMSKMEEQSDYMRSTATQTQTDDATALVSEMLHDYGYMTDGKWNHEMVAPAFESEGDAESFKRSQVESKDINNILNNHMALMRTDITASQAATSFRDVIDGRFSRQMKTGARKRIEEQAIKKQQMQNQVARPTSTSISAPEKKKLTSEDITLKEMRTINDKVTGLFD